MAAIALIAIALIIAGCGAAPQPTPTPLPPTATPEPRPPIEVLAAGQAAFIRTGCVACHAIKGISDQALAAPPLDNTYKMAIDTMKTPLYKSSEGKATNPREFILESILDPNAFTYPDCPQGPCVKGTMPNNYKDIVREEEMGPLVEYLYWLNR